jgi:hypothetical protein
MRWPTSAEYKLAIYPALRALFTAVDLLSPGSVGTRALVRFNPALLLKRADVLAVLLRERWGVDGRLADLPDAPLWWINATCIETGKNWRFGKREMGDWQFGRHYEPPLLLAEAAAASAAVPYAIGALRVSLPEQGWYATDPATNMATKRCEPAARHVHLWDGGAYDNLGLEPLYKPGEELVGCDFLLVSDASGPLGPPVSAIGSPAEATHNRARAGHCSHSTALGRLPMLQQHLDLPHRQLKIIDAEHAAGADKSGQQPLLQGLPRRGDRQQKVIRRHVQGLADSHQGGVVRLVGIAHVMPVAALGEADAARYFRVRQVQLAGAFAQAFCKQVHENETFSMAGTASMKIA